MLLYSALLVVLSALCVFAVSPPEVKTAVGTFRGRILTSMTGKAYAAYRGIPYAAPPTGDKRFSLPERFPVIEDVYDASDFGPICVQHIDGRVHGQEDCLYLNVYVPLNSKEEGMKKNPVLVFIHGGGLTIGSSNPYLPGDLVTSRNVLVVTMNYRLGFLGFLRGNSPSVPGNQGLWDQLLALRWVKENIEAFGGDSDEITVSGESMGSASASALSVSPLAKDLFKRGILMSSISFGMPTPHRTSNDILQSLSSRLGCGLDSGSDNIENTVECLKKAPLEEFNIDRNKEFIVALISSGDDLIPKRIQELVADPQYLYQAGFYDRNYIISITNDDGSVLINSRFQTTDTTNVDSAAPDVALMLNLPLSVTEKLFEEYIKLHKSVEKSAIAIITDGFFATQSIHFLDVYGNVSGLPARHKAYFMSFDHVPQYEPHRYMLHALDLVYLFDMKPDFLDCFYQIKFEGGFRDEDNVLRFDFINLIADFVRSGNPSITLSEQKGITWPAVHPGTRHYLSFSLIPSIRPHVLGDRRVIWEEMIPQWLSELQNSGSKTEL